MIRLPLALLLLMTVAWPSYAESPAPIQTGPQSIVLGELPAAPDGQQLPAGFSEDRLAAQALAMAAQREYGQEGMARVKALVAKIQESYRALAADPALAKLPSAFDLQLAGRAAPPCHYFLFVPEEAAKEPRPVVLLLHGAGGNFKLGFTGEIEAARKHGAILACPTFGDGAWWTKEGTAFAMKVLEDTIQRCKADRSRVLIAGVSNGATGAWRISETHRDRFAAVACVAGAFNGKAPVTASQGPPAYLVHGALDQVIPCALSRKAFEVLKARKGSVYHEVPDSGHFVAFERPELALAGALDWFAKVGK